MEQHAFSEVTQIDWGAGRRAGILRTTLAAVAVGGLLAGCTPAPDTAPLVPTRTPTPAPTATPAPRPTATPIPEIAVELAEDLLSERVNGALVGQPLADTPFGPATVAWMRVDFADGGIVLSGEAQAGFIRLPVAAGGTVHVESGRPLVRLGDVMVGGVVVPEPVRASLEQALQTEVDRALAAERFRAQTVTIDAGRLVVRGTRSEVP